MRGCLSVLILAAVFALGVTWFGGPPLAATVVQTSLTASGLQADDLEVAVSAAPPFKLVVGQADEVAISGTDVRWNDLEAETLHLKLMAVDLLARTAVSAEGSLEGVDLAEPGAESALATVTFAGPAEAAEMIVRLDAATVQRLASAAFERELGVQPEGLELVGPNIVRFRTPLGPLDGTLEIEDDGALGVRYSLGTVRVVDAIPMPAIRLTGVEVTDGGLELTGDDRRRRPAPLSRARPNPLLSFEHGPATHDTCTGGRETAPSCACEARDVDRAAPNAGASRVEGKGSGPRRTSNATARDRGRPLPAGGPDPGR